MVDVRVTIPNQTIEVLAKIVICAILVRIIMSVIRHEY